LIDTPYVTTAHGGAKTWRFLKRKSSLVHSADLCRGRVRVRAVIDRYGNGNNGKCEFIHYTVQLSRSL